MQAGFYTNYTDVKFIDKRGLALLAPDLKAALARGAHGRLLTFTYQNFTDVASLQFFYDLQTRWKDRECFRGLKINVSCG